jgi:DNA-directed RNA polymerase specialized sigma24 family protein
MTAMMLNRPTEEQAITLAHRRAAIRRNLGYLRDDYERVLVLLHAIGFKQKELATFQFGIGRQRIGQIILRARRRMEAGDAGRTYGPGRPGKE